MPGPRRGPPWLPFAALFVAIVLLLLGCVLVFPSYLVDRDLGPFSPSRLSPDARLKATNDVRATLLQGLGGAFFLATAFFTWRQIRISQRQLQLGEDQQIADRFSRAIEQLSKNALDLRLGGIYSLEQLAVVSATYCDIVAEVLAAFVREHAPLLPAGAAAPEVAEDVQAAVTVLGRSVCRRRRTARPVNLAHVSLPAVDLRDVTLPRVNLNGSVLAKAHLDGAKLPEAMLIGARLEGAFLRRTDLSHGKLIDAHLEGAIMESTVLRDADLNGAVVDHRTRLFHAHVEGAKLRNVPLAAARHAHLSWDERTEWPAGYEPAPSDEEGLRGGPPVTPSR